MNFTLKRTSVMAAAIVFAAYGSRLQAQTSDAPSGADKFNQTLAQDYQALSEIEGRLGDRRDAETYARRAAAAAGGEPTAPDQIELRQPFLKQKYVSELSEARQRLMAALGGTGRSNAPMSAARAQTSYDCWLEQASEDLEPDDIEACKRTFLSAVGEVENAVAQVEPPPVPQPSPSPSPQMPATGTNIVSLDGTHFDFDKSTLRPAAITKLDAAVKIMNDNPGIEINIEGHTDSVGSDAYNEKLSERRAAAVRAYLVREGIDDSRLNSIGYGESRPEASNDTAEGRAQNRRVDLIVAGQ
jgi:OmpA-OmpF porin, OOP family